MISSQTTVFTIENEQYQFSCTSFNMCVNQYAKKKHLKKTPGRISVGKQIIRVQFSGSQLAFW